MRPDRCWIQVSMLAAMVLCLNADGEEPECTPVIVVNRSEVYEAVPGEELRIKCKVRSCEERKPKVSWFKYEGKFIPIGKISQSRFETEWKQLELDEGISYLIFKDILRNDSGDYRCEIGDETSYFIKIKVSDEFRKNSTAENTGPEPTEWLYLYSAAGTATLVVVVVVISVVAMRGCKGKSKEDKQADSQYMMIPMTAQPPPQPRPRVSPIAPRSRTSIQRKTQDQEKEDRGRGRTAVRDNQETGKSIVYAALNHPLPPRGGARPRPPVEAPSEYAAIRVA